MVSMLLGAAVVAVGLPALLIVCICVTGNRLIRATEMSEGDCARSLARDVPHRPTHAQSATPRFAASKYRRMDGTMDVLAN